MDPGGHYSRGGASEGRRPGRSLAPLLYSLLAGIVVIGLGIGLGAYFGTRGGDSHDEAALITAGSSSSTSVSSPASSSSTADTVFSQQEGEIYLEASGASGPESFAGEQFVPQGPSTTLKIPNPAVTLPPMTTSTATATATSAPPAAQPVALASYPGDTPALYGGSKSKVIADKEGELRFLEQNPLKAAAFCEALNSDPTLRWSGGNQVRPDQLRDYFAELTPMMLTRDIRVTNYGYRNGHPTPRQSVLQAGQLVLVDRYGVPRKRCECGNPLTPPRPAKRPPVYTGPKWPGFNPTTIIIIQQTTVIINNFTIIDIYTGQPFGRPAGSDGGSDGAPPSLSGPTTSMAMNSGTGPPPSSGGTGGTGGTGGQAGQLEIKPYVVSNSGIDRLEGAVLEMHDPGDTVTLKGPITIHILWWNTATGSKNNENVEILEAQTHGVTVPIDCPT